jgi:hypothetical protein
MDIATDTLNLRVRRRPVLAGAVSAAALAAG